MQRRSFSREFKVEAVRLVRERGVSVAQAARDLDLHENVLWKRAQQLADVESPEGLSPPGAPKTVHDRLQSHGSRCSAVAVA